MELFFVFGAFQKERVFRLNICMQYVKKAVLILYGQAVQVIT